jgi:GT2 family glycosyltransferase
MSAGAAWPEVSVVIVNWNGLRDTAECLESLRKMAYPDYRVIVVDNGSVKDADEIERSYKGFATVLRSASNLGFAGGNNIAIRRALEDGTSRYLLLLNNDTVVYPDMLTHLVAAAETDERAGIIGGAILDYRDSRRVWYSGGRLDLFRGEAYHSRGMPAQDGPPSDVTFITGCLMLVRADLFRRIGLMPEEYFLSVEDMDLCYQAMRAGYRLKVDSRPAVLHKVSASRGGEHTADEVYYKTRNRLHFMLRRVRNPFYVFPFIVFFHLSRAVKFLGWSMASRGDFASALIEGLRDGWAARMGPRPGSGRAGVGA